MRKRFFASLLSLCMVVSLLPGTAFATESDTSAETKLPDAKGGVITLEQDTTATLTVNADQNITLDLAGFTLTNQVGQHTIVVEKGGTLTVTGTGTVDNVSHGKAAVYNAPGGTVILNGGTFTRSAEASKDANNSGGNSFYTLKNFGTMTVNDGVVVNQGADGNGKFSSLVANGWQKGAIAGQDGAEPAVENGGASLTINGGTFNGGLNTIKNDDYGQLTINGGTFKNVAQAAVLNWNVATITNGTFTSGKNCILNGGGNETLNRGELTINGGSFTCGEGSKVLAAMDGNSTYLKAENIQVSGGTFSDESVKNFVVPGKVLDESGNVVDLSAANAVAEINGTYYKTLAAAIEASKDNDTVKLLKNAECSERIWIDKNVVLDLGGFTLTSSSDYTLLVSAGKSLTLKNGILKTTNDDGAAIFGGKSSIITVEKDATLETAGSGVMATNSSGDEGNATLNIYGTLNCQVIGVWGQGPKNTINIDGATINSGYWGVYQNGSFGGCNITIKNSTIVDAASDGAGVYISNSKANKENADQGMQTLTIEDSSITGATAVEVKYTDVTIKGENTKLTATGTPESETLNSNGSVTYGYSFAITHNGTDSSKDSSCGTVTIENGAFKGLIGIQEPSESVEYAATITISNGLFSSDPSAYCGEGSTGVANTDSSTSSKYPFTVGEKGETPAEIALAAPKVSYDENNTDAKTAAEEIGKPTAVTNIEGSGIAAAAADKANRNVYDPADETIVNNLKTATGDQTITAAGITIVVQYYMDIKVTDAATAEDGSKTLTLDITPKARTVATTVTNLANDEIITETEDENEQVNAVVLKDNETLDVTGEVTLTLPLPNSFATGDSLNVKHIKNNGKTYIYTGTVKDNVVTFTNPHGFSTFILGVEAPAATIGDVGYETLQAAVDDVQDGQTITVNETGEATVANKTISFKVTCNNGVTATIKDYQGNTLTPDANGVYKVTRKSSGSGSGTTTYAITTNSPANGTVTASPKSAAKGATVTLTVTPTEGYQLDKLTVADKDGKEITLTDKGNGKYTFTMPASKVEVTATFKQAPVTHVCPAEKYTDVDTTQWYHEGVDYVIANGMMNGTGTNIFEPNATTTRGMIVTILYRLEKEPAAGTSPFTDVDADQWYAKAVAWAAANGVVNGTSPTTFNPNDPITREQMAAILYRYASFKGYDVTGKADLAGYTDASQISAYAKDAMSWANKAGLIGGVSATTLQPQGSATRAQVATILMRFCENVAK